MARCSWTAMVSVLDKGRYWRQFPAFTVDTSSMHVAASMALRIVRQHHLKKGARIDEVLVSLKRQPKTEATS